MLCTSAVLNNSSIDEGTKYLLRVSLKLKQSTRMCLTVSGHWQVVHSGWSSPATFMGLTDSLECSFSCHDQRSVTAARLDPYSEPAKRGWSLALAARGWTCGKPLSRGLVGERHGAGQTHGMLNSTSALFRPETQSRPQVVQVLPFSSSLHTSVQRNL